MLLYCMYMYLSYLLYPLLASDTCAKRVCYTMRLTDVFFVRIDCSDCLFLKKYANILARNWENTGRSGETTIGIFGSTVLLHNFIIYLVLTVNLLFITYSLYTLHFLLNYLVTRQKVKVCQERHLLDAFLAVNLSHPQQ